MSVESMTKAQARRVALRAQGLDRPRSGDGAGAPTLRDLTRLVDRLGLLQIDSVNVFARAHLMPTFSRLGVYDPGLLDVASSRAPRRLVESWAHEASYVPPSVYRLLGWRRRAERDRAWASADSVPHRHAGLVEEVRAELDARGPQTAAQLHALVAHRHPRGPRDSWGWNWSAAKQVVEYLFAVGDVTSAGRTPAFERRYDLAARVLPRAVLDAGEPSDADAARELVARAARAHGVATLRCLADYYRMSTARARPAVLDLVEAGELVPVEVHGWGPAYRHRDAVVPRRVTGARLLSPFDPLIFERRRLHELFDLHYRIEIYTPPAQRVWGYYVLPFLLDGRIAALVDLKAARASGVLQVAAAHRTPGADPALDAEVAAALAAELRLAATWLGLADVAVGGAGDLAPALSGALGVAAPVPH